MRRIVLLLASAALAVLFIAAITSSPPTEAQTTAGQPNFVFILTDDMQRQPEIYAQDTQPYRVARHDVRERVRIQLPVRSSRATIMRGQYAHNTGFGVTVTVPIVVGKATRTTATSKTT